RHLRLRQLAELEAEGEVLLHGHVGVERVALEDHGDVALLRREVVHDPVADPDLAGADLLEARQHPQRRRLPAARRADDDHQLAVVDRQVEVVDGGRAVVVDLRDLFVCDLSQDESLVSRCVTDRYTARGLVIEPWWRGGVLYQIYPRSFADANGDGIGDLEGVVSRLDYLDWLGVDAIWLNPIYPSPNVDWGYDVADYTAVDPDYGTLDDLDRLVAEAGRRGIGVLLDLV